MHSRLFCAFLLAALLSCTDRQRHNPLDPLTPSPEEGTVRRLEALAGDGEVRLRWDYSHFDDLGGYHLYRRVGKGEFIRHPNVSLSVDAREYVDTAVENGTTYEYRLGLLIQGDGERLLDRVEPATPGPEVAWVADRRLGLVWKISADGRGAWFAQGRFPSIAGMALDRRDGSCWVSERFFKGLYRITPDGELELHPANVGEAGLLRIDPEAGIGWLVDVERREVKWFSPEAGTDSLEMVAADANFKTPSALAPQGGGCWIVDREDGRALFYAPGEDRSEFGARERPGAIAAGAGGRAWVLVEDGRGLLRLARNGERLTLELPFGNGVAVDVDRQTGDCWVVGEGDVAAFDPNGGLLQRWTDLPGGASLAVDEVNRHAWIATREFLWKFTLTGESLARLGGFSEPLWVAVDSGAF